MSNKKHPMNPKPPIAKRFKGFWQQAHFLGRLELRIFKRHTQLLWAAGIALLIPAIYLLIYLSSVWDPTGRATTLPVGLVNQDQGFSYRDKSLNVGNEIIRRLEDKKQFGYRKLNSAQEARQMVRSGKLAFTLIIPANFSANAIPAREEGSGQLVVYTSAGNNYESSLLAAQFARVLGEDVNRTLSEQRWALVLSSSVGSQQGVERLREGVAKLSQGAKELASGTVKTEGASAGMKQGFVRLQSSIDKLTEGTQTLGNGIRATAGGLPPVENVRDLRLGAETLAAGQQDLSKGLNELLTGHQKLLQSVEAFRLDLDNRLFVPAPLLEGVTQLSESMVQIEQGLRQAADGQQKLSAGMSSLNNNLRTLTFGIRDLRRGMNAMAGALPEEQQINQMSAGTAELAQNFQQLHEGVKRLNEGAQYLTVGLDLMLKELPGAAPAMEGSAAGLAHSVSPQLEIEDVVDNYGSGFAPNIIPLALWLGAGVAAFLIHVRLQPRLAKQFSRRALVSGKVFVPSVLVLIQAALIFSIVRFVLNISVQNPAALALTLACSALTFMLIVFALTRALGDAGKALAMLFLALQISASGGFMPVELTGSVYSEISPWLPMTWVVKSIKASMFGAYESNWQSPLMIVAAWGICAFAVATLVGRWRFVASRNMRPTMDL